MGSKVKSKATSSLCRGYARGLSLSVCTCLQGLGAQHGLEMALSLDNTIRKFILFLEYFWTTLTQWTKAGISLDREATHPSSSLQRITCHSQFLQSVTFNHCHPSPRTPPPSSHSSVFLEGEVPFPGLRTFCLY